MRRRTPETTRRHELDDPVPCPGSGEREADRSASLELAEVAPDVIELDRVRPAGRGRLAKKIATDRQLIFELVDRALKGREPRLLGPAQCVVRVVHQANADGPWLTARAPDADARGCPADAHRQLLGARTVTPSTLAGRTGGDPTRS